MKAEWSVSRSTIARPDGQRRWDYAYQFLVRWAMEQEASSNPTPLPKQEEDQNGSSPICSSFDQWSTTKSDH
jgi:hypothetical protein